MGTTKYNSGLSAQYILDMYERKMLEYQETHRLIIVACSQGQDDLEFWSKELIHLYDRQMIIMNAEEVTGIKKRLH